MPPPPTKIAAPAALCDFICHSCRARTLPFSAAAFCAPFARSSALPLVVQSRPYSSQNEQRPRFPRRAHGRKQQKSHPKRPRAHVIPPDPRPTGDRNMPHTPDLGSLFKDLEGVDPDLLEQMMGRDPSGARARAAQDGADAQGPGPGPGSGPDPGPDPDLVKVAKDLGLDDQTIEDLMDDEKFEKLVGDDKPDVNMFHEEDDGTVTMEDNNISSDKERARSKLRKLEEALRENEEEMQKMNPKGFGEMDDLMETMQKMDSEDPDTFKGTGREAIVNLPSDSAGPAKVDLKAVILPEDAWAAPSKHLITHLNDMLIRVGVAIKTDLLNPKTINKTWRCYCKARNALSLRPHLVPKATWDLLWGIFSTNNNDMVPDKTRLHRVYLVAQDMTAANISLAPKQQLLAIEAMFADGWKDEAIKNWKRHTTTLGTSPATLVDYWHLGAHMHCLQGDLERAGNAVRQVLTSGLEHDPRILFLYIDACARTLAYREAAWQAYRQLRDILGDQMVLTDYDEVINTFLSHGLTEHALYAFVDMMSGGTIDLYGRAKLPGTIANKFFFGKWLKRLIGAGDLNGAEAVFKMMLERGVRPAPIQLNGLIGAWLRAGNTESRKKAYDMAWEMIYSRLDFVQARANAPTLKLEGVQRPVDARPPDYRPPRATSETFALLASFYRNHLASSKLETLWRVVKAAEIPIDGHLLGPVLETYQQTGREQEAFDLLFNSARHNRLQMGWETFKPLWVILGNLHAAFGTQHQHTGDGTRARRVFFEMMKSAPSLIADKPKAPENTARLILSTFVRLGDMHGALIALHALVDRFNLLVTDLVALHVSTGQWSLDHKRTRVPGQAVRIRKAAFQIAKFIATRLASTRRDLNTLSAGNRSKELTLYLDRVLSKKIPGLGTDKDVDNMHQDVCMEMGVKYTPRQGPTIIEDWE